MINLEEKLDFKGTMTSFIPTTILGAVAMGVAQQATFNTTQSSELAIAAGLGAQTTVRSLTILVAHAALHKNRLKKEDRGYAFGTYTQEMVSIASSAKVLYTPFLAGVVGIDAYLLSEGQSNLVAGGIASLSSGTLYAITLSMFSPKINNLITTTRSYIVSQLSKYKV